MWRAFLSIAVLFYVVSIFRVPHSIVNSIITLVWFVMIFIPTRT
jgi:hypothetical protein